MLDPTLERSLAKFFRAPVIESYALSEVLGVLSASPFPPDESKAGSVGLVKQKDMRLIDQDGKPVPQGEVGCIAVPAHRKIRYYNESPDELASAGYFNTGDLGFLDKDGFLFLVGREKEIINRGGEKISPHELEAVLLSHEKIQEAVAFPIPSETYGEEICVAIVPTTNDECLLADIETLMRANLSPNFLPDKYMIVKKIPKNETGKYERLKMAISLMASE